jgi:hypothetical protein
LRNVTGPTLVGSRSSLAGLARLARAGEEHFAYSTLSIRSR